VSSDSYRYIIRQYGEKLDVNTEVHRLELTLERIAGQAPLEDIRKIPKPSQLDDWILFEKLEAEMIKQTRGNQGFLAWKVVREEDRIDRENWRRAREFQASLVASEREVSP
jgi:hypothetical protein